MKRNSTALLIPVILFFAVSLVAQDFDDQKPVKKVQVKTVNTKKADEEKPAEKIKAAEEPVKVEEVKPAEGSDTDKKNLHPALSEDEAFDELLKDIRGGNLEHVDSLISTFPKLQNRQDKFGQTPVFNAVSANQYPIVELLVKMNADIKQSNIYEDTPFHRAAQAGDIKSLELLMKAGASIWKKNIKGESPLMKAVSAGQIETVKFLIKNNAELNAPDSKGDTPLHRAAVKGDNDMVKLLLALGADVGVKNKEGMKPADLAKKPEIKEMIEARDPTVKR